MACLRISVKIIALLDVILTLFSIILIIKIIRGVYELTPSLTKKEVAKVEISPELEKDDGWITNDKLSFEERSRLMHLEQEKWRKRVNLEREENSSFTSFSPESFAYFGLWLIFAIFLSALELLTLFMSIRLFLSTNNKETHRNDVQRTIKLWIIPAVLFTILSILSTLFRRAVFLRRERYFSDYIGPLEIANIIFRPVAIILVCIYYWQVSNQRFPGDSDQPASQDEEGNDFYGVDKPDGPKMGGYPMEQSNPGQFIPGTIIQEPGGYPMQGQTGGWIPDAQPPPYSRY